MPPILFSHPQIPTSLTVDTGANDVVWSYTLNTATYPTYAGEVVQVLSTAIDNLTITGEVRTVAQMEGIYRWFLTYMQMATQGTGGTEYSEYAVKMQYPHRGWTLYIQPIGLPGLRYGRDVVVPTWQLQAHILDPDKEMEDLSIDAAILSVDPMTNFNELTTFQQLHAGVGFREANPYSDPLAPITEEEYRAFYDDKIPNLPPHQGEGRTREDVNQDLEGVAKKLSDYIEQYASNKFVALDYTGASKPADPQGDKDSDKPDSEKNG